MDSNFTNENDPWEYSLDIDDSDLHLTHVLRSSSSAHVEPSPYTPNPVTIIPGPAGVVQLSNSICVEPSSSTPNPVRIIPGPAGLVQRAKLLKENVFILDPDGALMSTQEYMQKVVEDVGEDADFNSGAWVSATNYVNAFGGTVTGCLGDIDNFLKKGKLEQVVAIVKSCSPNALGDLNVTLKDLSGTVPGTIHYKVLDVGSYEKDITVGAAMILANVSVFTPKPSKHYLNITKRNVVELEVKLDLYLYLGVAAPRRACSHGDDDTYVVRSFQPWRATDWIHRIIMQLLYCLLGLSETRRLLLLDCHMWNVMRCEYVEPTRFLARHCRQNGACIHGGSTDLYQAEGINITANSMRPGFIAIIIDIFRGYKIFLGIYRRQGSEVLVAQGATTTCYIVLNPKVKGVTGKYFSNSNLAEPSMIAKDQDLAKELWDFSCCIWKCMNIVEADGEADDPGALASVGCLRAISTILELVSRNKPLLRHSSQVNANHNNEHLTKTIHMVRSGKGSGGKGGGKGGSKGGGGGGKGGGGSAKSGCGGSGESGGGSGSMKAPSGDGSSRKYYRYIGSLTTPSYIENIV
ncbi:hypothetical protein Tco_1502796 [Tanacetum coccineum]